MALIPEQTAIGDGQFLHRLVRALCERRDLGLIAHAVGWESALPTVLQPQNEVSSPEAACSLRQFAIALVRDWARWHHPDGETIDRRSGYQKRGRAGDPGFDEDELQIQPDPIEQRSVRAFYEASPRVGAPYRGLGTSDEEGPRAGYRAWCAAAAAMISDMRYFVLGLTPSHRQNIYVGPSASVVRLARHELIKTGPGVSALTSSSTEHSILMHVAHPADDEGDAPSFVSSAIVVESKLLEETSTDEPQTENFDPVALPNPAWDWSSATAPPTISSSASLTVFSAFYSNSVTYRLNWRWAVVVDSDGTTKTDRVNGYFTSGERYTAQYVGEHWLYNPCTIPCDVYARLTQADDFEDPDPAPVQIGGVKNAPSDDDLNPAGATWKKIGTCEARDALRVLPPLSSPPDVMSFLKGKCEDPPPIGEFAIDEQTGSRVIDDRPGRKSSSYVQLSMTFMLDYGPYFQHFPGSGDPLPQPDPEE